MKLSRLNSHFSCSRFTPKNEVLDRATQLLEYTYNIDTMCRETQHEFSMLALEPPAFTEGCEHLRAD